LPADTDRSTDRQIDRSTDRHCHAPPERRNGVRRQPPRRGRPRHRIGPGQHHNPVHLRRRSSPQGRRHDTILPKIAAGLLTRPDLVDLDLPALAHAAGYPGTTT